MTEAAGFRVKAFSSAEEFLEHPLSEERACLILDVVLPGLSGLELQRRLVERGSRLRVVFLSGSDDDQVREQAMRAGALAFLQKPIEAQDLLDAVRRALS